MGGIWPRIFLHWFHRNISNSAPSASRRVMKAVATFKGQVPKTDAEAPQAEAPHAEEPNANAGDAGKPKTKKTATKFSTNKQAKIQVAEQPEGHAD